MANITLPRPDGTKEVFKGRKVKHEIAGHLMIFVCAGVPRDKPKFYRVREYHTGRIVLDFAKKRGEPVDGDVVRRAIDRHIRRMMRAGSSAEQFYQTLTRTDG